MIDNFYSLVHRESSTNKAAENLIIRFDKMNILSAKGMALAALVSLILLTGSLIAGRFVYVEFINGAVMSVGCGGGLFFGGVLSISSVLGVAHYLQAKNAKKQFSLPLSEMDPAFRNSLIKDLNTNKNYYNNFFKDRVEEIQEMQDAINILERARPPEVEGIDETETRQKKIQSIIQISIMIFATLLALGGFALYIYACGQANLSGSHFFSKMDALSVIGITSSPLAIGIGGLAWLLIQDKKRENDPNKFSTILW